VRLKIFTLICLVGFMVARLHGQAAATASRVGDLQFGAMFNLANTDYRPENFKGYGFYSTYDFKSGFDFFIGAGVENCSCLIYATLPAAHCL
jgi:hypothetical protein